MLSGSDALTQLRDVEHRIYPTLPTGAAELVTRIAQADAIINIRSSTRFSADVLADCPQLRLISIWGTEPITSIRGGKGARDCGHQHACSVCCCGR